MASYHPQWYDSLAAGQDVRRIDLKDPAGRSSLDALLAEADALLTSSRPSALTRLGLGWRAVSARHPRLTQVAITGYPAPDGERTGHDLTYLASEGLLSPPSLPLTLIADLAGAERAVSAVAVLLLARERGGTPGYMEVSLGQVARAPSLASASEMARPTRTAPPVTRAVLPRGSTPRHQR
jgi:crotonobetainyl-CoA:carnitine CoA-transferase CaiB-like acyl-CoA transferase